MASPLVWYDSSHSPDYHPTITAADISSDYSRTATGHLLLDRPTAIAIIVSDTMMVLVLEISYCSLVSKISIGLDDRR